MRCTTCRSTGYTEEELADHEKLTGHVRDSDPREWKTSDSFPEQTRTPQLDPAAVLEALKALGPAAIGELQRKLAAPTMSSEPAKHPGSGEDA